MANPCGFTYTSKIDGKEYTVSTMDEILEVYKNGHIDGSKVKEIINAEKIQDQNTAIMDAVSEIKDADKLSNEELKERVGFITSMMNEAYRAGTYTAKQVRDINKAALNITKAANKNLAIAKFVEMLDKNVSIKDWEKKETQLINKRKTLSKQVINAKVTKNEYYLRKLAGFLALDLNDIPANMVELYERTLGMGISKGTNIDLMVANADMVIQATYGELENINYLSDKIQDFSTTPEYNDIIDKNIVNVAEKMYGDGLISQIDRDFIIDNQEKFFEGGKTTSPTKQSKDILETITEIRNQKSALEGMRGKFADLFDKATRKRLDFVLNNLSEEYLNSLGQGKAESLLQTLSIMKGGYQSRALESFKVSIDSFNRSKKLSDLFINNFQKNFFFQAEARAKQIVKTIAGIKTDYSKEVLRKTFGFGIDSLYFKNLGGKNPLYEAIFGKSASIFGQSKELQDRIDNEYVSKGLSILERANGYKPNEIIKSNIKIGLWLVQEMHNAGMENSPEVKKYFEDIFKDPTKQDIYNDREIEYIKSVIDNVGNADFLTPQEMSAVSVIRDALRETVDMSTEFSFFDLGKPIVRNEAYFPIRLSKVRGESFDSIKQNFMNGRDVNATGLQAKTGATGGDFVLNLKDVFGIVESHTKEISLMGLRSESRTVKKTIEKLRQDILSNTTLSQKEKNQRLLYIRNLEQSYESSLDTSIGLNFVPKSVADEVFDAIGNIATTTKLVGTGKALADLLANAVNALEKPKELIDGIQITKNILTSEDLNHNKIIGVIGGAQAYRLAKRKTGLLGGPEILTTGKRSSRRTEMKSEAVDQLRRAKDLSFDVLGEKQMALNRLMINNPDLAVAIPLFYGSFEAKFIELTGKKPDYKKIQENDIDYIDANLQAIEEASTYADINISKTVGTKNPFSISDVLKQNPNQGIGQRIWQLSNQFFNGFNSAIGESVKKSFREGKDSGLKTAGVKFASNIMYSSINRLVNGLIVTGFGSLIGGSMSNIDETEEDKIGSTKRALIDGVIQTATQSGGNLAKFVAGSVAGEINKQLGEGVTFTGKYDGRFGSPSKKGLGFNKPISEILDKGVDVSEMTTIPSVQIAGKAVGKVIDAVSPEEKTEQETIAINKKNQMSRAFRISDALSAIGVYPLSKDIQTGLSGVKNQLIYNRQYLKEQGKDLSVEELRDFQLKAPQALRKTVFDLFWLDFYGDNFYSKEEVKAKKEEASKKLNMIFDTKSNEMKFAIPVQYNENFVREILDSDMPEQSKRFYVGKARRFSQEEVYIGGKVFNEAKADIKKYKENPLPVKDISKEVDALISEYEKGNSDIEFLVKRLEEDIIYSNDKESVTRLIQFIEDKNLEK